MRYNRATRREITKKIRSGAKKMTTDQRKLERQRLMAKYMAFMAADFEIEHGAIDDTDLFIEEIMGDVKKFLQSLGEAKK